MDCNLTQDERLEGRQCRSFACNPCADFHNREPVKIKTTSEEIKQAEIVYELTKLLNDANKKLRALERIAREGLQSVKDFGDSPMWDLANSYVKKIDELARKK